MKPYRRHQLWILPLLLSAVLGGVVAIRAWQPTTTSGDAVAHTPAADGNEQPIDLAIDIGDGVSRKWQVAWQPGMTVQDALHTADKMTYSVQGRGSAAFLTELVGLPNQGPGGRNWQFEVNGKWSDRSLGIHPLEPGDRVLWKFQANE